MTTSRLLRKTIYFVMLISFMLLGGSLALLLGKDLNWDLGNYHFYNPYALLHFRYDLDYWPASLNTFYNPLMDFLIYYLINSYSPMCAGFFLGAIQGITLWLVFQIALLYLPFKTTSLYFAGFLAIAGACCPQFISGIGMSLGDLTVGIFILGSIFISLKYIKGNYTSAKLLVTSGLMLGFAIGLKLTSSFYWVGMFFAYILNSSIPFSKRLKIISFLGLSVLLGALCTSGYWMIFLWHRFHNPIYPLYNAFFQGVGFPFINWHDERFYPHSFLQTIFYPFYFSKNGLLVDDIKFEDYRLSLLYILYILVGIKALGKILRIKTENFSPLSNWLIYFFLFSYIAWEFMFSFLRYAVILEMLVPLMVFVLVERLLPNRKLLYLPILALLYAAILLTMTTEVAERGSWQDPSYFGIDIPSNVMQINKALVLLPTSDYHYASTPPLSLAYLIPSLPKDWQFVGFPFTNTNVEIALPLAVRHLMVASARSLFLLAEKQHLAKINKSLMPLNLSVGNTCYEIKIAHGVRRTSQIFLCQLIKNQMG